ncbi:MAG TPA: HAMP domain-containing sensor histidine kinase [Solirubrobacteraceae bacterium]|jgi:two-component system sensor histidine kinase MprB|nr:HAMP domain-containing sensor histidine kinase [Solirubrobacteraceae bacterium]
MSLRLRITGATALAVAAVAASIGVIGYLSVRSHMRGEIDRALSDRVIPFLQPRPFPPLVTGGPLSGVSVTRVAPGLQPPQGLGLKPLEARAGPGSPVIAVAPPGLVSRVPPPEPFGGASGYFQFVGGDGNVLTRAGTAPPLPSALPVDARVRAIASSGRGRYFTDETVNGIHLRVLTVADPYDHAAVQVARPLTEVDQVLHGLLVSFALLVGGGIALAAVLATSIGRAALAPIARFVRRTEAVSGALDGSQRLEEGGASELSRLAGAFNHTLEALERSVAAQRHLVADASHELRTPIAALRSNIQIFLQSHRLPAHDRAALQTSVVAELDELTRLVSDVVELARGTEPSEQLETIELDQLVSEAVDRAQRRSPSMRYDVQLEPTLIENVPDRVARAISNVLDNARQWSPPGGRIEVHLRDSTLSVRDHGPGFNERDLPFVFDRFYRADSARRMPGSGLGLAIVRQAAEAHGGSVCAQNAPGGGALVRASFAATGPQPSAA